VAILAWLARLPSHHRSFRYPLIWPMAAFFAASLASAALSANPGPSLYSLKGSVLPLLFFLVCVNSLSLRPGRMIRLLVGAGGVAAVVGLAQTVQHGTGFRIQGTFGHYMTFAGVLLVIGFLGSSQLLHRPQPGRRAWFILALVLIFIALLMTQTRSAWLGVVAGCLPLVWSRRKRLLLALPLVVALVFLLSPQPIKMRIGSIFDLQDVTMQQRLSLWQSGLEIFLDHPLFGVGPDNLEEIYPLYNAAPETPRGFTHLHSNVVQIAAESGLVGLLAWLWIWVAYFRCMAGVHRRALPDDPAARALLFGSLAAVLGFLAAGLFECNYRDSEVVGLLFFAMALPFSIDVAAPKVSPAARG